MLFRKLNKKNEFVLYVTVLIKEIVQIIHGFCCKLSF